MSTPPINSPQLDYLGYDASVVLSGSGIQTPIKSESRFTTSDSTIIFGESISSRGSSIGSPAGHEHFTSNRSETSLNASTSGLPIANIASIYNFPGISKASSIQSGSMHGQSVGNEPIATSSTYRGSVINSDPVIFSRPDIGNAPLSSGSTYIPSSRKIPNIPLDQHQLNVDPNPVMIKKKPTERIKYTQNISLRLLKPPTPPQPGDITITQEQDVQAPAAPPLHLTQKPTLPINPEPLIVRERPPKPPMPIGPKNIVITGRIIPPPPRQVIVERLPQLPPKPQEIFVERWLGYERRTRNVNFIPAAPIVPASTPKNILIEWEQADVNINQNFTFLGVQEADPGLTLFPKFKSNSFFNERIIFYIQK